MISTTACRKNTGWAAVGQGRQSAEQEGALAHARWLNSQMPASGWAGGWR